MQTKVNANKSTKRADDNEALVDEIYYDAEKNAIICCFDSKASAATIAATIAAIEKAV